MVGDGRAGRGEEGGWVVMWLSTGEEGQWWWWRQRVVVAVVGGGEGEGSVLVGVEWVDLKLGGSQFSRALATSLNPPRNLALPPQLSRPVAEEGGVSGHRVCGRTNVHLRVGVWKCISANAVHVKGCWLLSWG